MKNILTVIIILLLFVSAAKSQNDYRNGKIIFWNNDSLLCRISYRGDIDNSIRCVYSKDDGVHKIFYPKDISGYVFDKDKYYVSKSYKTADSTYRLFIQYLVKGRKNLYFCRDNSGDHFLIDYKSDTVIGLPYSEQIVNQNGVFYSTESTIHMGLLKSYFSDCPPIFSQIENLRQPDFDNLIAVTKKYHQLTCGDTGCVIYYKPKPKFKISIEPQFGMIRYNHADKYISQFGGLVYIWLPRSNEHLYAKTGIVIIPDFPRYKYALRIPLQFEYLFPDHFIRPRFDAGINFYSLKYADKTYDNGLTLNLAGGILLKLTDFLYISLDAEIDFYKFKSVVSELLSHSLNGGLYIKF
jgi:hypothetical protein